MQGAVTATTPDPASLLEPFCTTRWIKNTSQPEGEQLEDYDIVDGGIKQHSDNLALSTLRMVL